MKTLTEDSAASLSSSNDDSYSEIDLQYIENCPLANNSGGWRMSLNQVMGNNNSNNNNNNNNNTALTTGTDVTTTTTIGTKETQDVYRSRVVVLIVLITSAVSVAITTFFLIQNAQQKAFRTSFNQNSIKVLQTIPSVLENSISSLDMMATAVVSHASSTNMTWPFVTIPDFPNRAAKALSSFFGVSLYFVVLVQPAERYQWEQYTADHRHIVNDTLRFMSKDKSFYGNATREYYKTESESLQNNTGLIADTDM
jgi:hypothetical protein